MSQKDAIVNLKSIIREKDAEIAALRYALRWTSAALQEACRRPTIITEKDRWCIGDETRATGEILASAIAALHATGTNLLPAPRGQEHSHG
ncbi:hypothetical protein [Castellaniella sp. UC4442_H9]